MQNGELRTQIEGEATELWGQGFLDCPFCQLRGMVLLVSRNLGRGGFLPRGKKLVAPVSREQGSSKVGVVRPFPYPAHARPADVKGRGW